MLVPAKLVALASAHKDEGNQKNYGGSMAYNAGHKVQLEIAKLCDRVILTLPKNGGSTDCSLTSIGSLLYTSDRSLHRT